jgi:hypothetical protein
MGEAQFGLIRAIGVNFGILIGRFDEFG